MSAPDFEQFKDYFEYRLRGSASDSRGGRHGSLRKLSSKLGSKSPSLLSMVASGTRLPSPALLEALLEEWDVPAQEREIVRLKVEIEKRKRSGKGIGVFLSRLEKIAPRSRSGTLTMRVFSAMSEWYMLVLREMVDAPGFIEDPVLISRRLRRKVTPAQVRKGLATLLEIGLLKRDPATGRLQPSTPNVETAEETYSEAVREHHAGMIRKASEALAEQAPSDRHFNSLTFKLAPERLPELKQEITAFVKGINERYGADASEAIFQLNVQLFQHTDNLQRKGHS